MQFRRSRRSPGPEAPGWDAITAAAEKVHPDQEPVHRGLTPGVQFGSPLQGISAYRSAEGWHLITYGLTELWQKESDDATISGWGYELTLRTPPGAEPPAWAFALLVGIAQQTQQSGVTYRVGDRISTGSPIDGGASSLTALAVMADPEIEPVQTPNGAVEFRRLVGVTADEITRMKATSTAAVLAEIGQITDTDR